jgi:hypothetical protein
MTHWRTGCRTVGRFKLTLVPQTLNPKPQTIDPLDNLGWNRVECASSLILKPKQRYHAFKFCFRLQHAPLPHGTPQWHVAANLRARGFLRAWGGRSFWAAAASVVGRSNLKRVESRNESAWFQRLVLRCGILVSRFAFNSNFRHYTLVACVTSALYSPVSAAAAAGLAVGAAAVAAPLVSWLFLSPLLVAVYRRRLDPQRRAAAAVVLLQGRQGLLLVHFLAPLEPLSLLKPPNVPLKQCPQSSQRVDEYETLGGGGAGMPRCEPYRRTSQRGGSNSRGPLR